MEIGEEEFVENVINASRLLKHFESFKTHEEIIYEMMNKQELNKIKYFKKDDTYHFNYANWFHRLNQGIKMKGE